MNNSEKPRTEIDVTPGTTGIALAIEDAEKNTNVVLNVGDVIVIATCCQNQY